MTKSAKKKTSDGSDATPSAPGGPGKDEAMNDFSYSDDEEAPDACPAAGSTEDTAHYIAEMVGSLALMAREARLDLLNYLLDMAHVEAQMQARPNETPDDGA
jgi:hypothetical protein